MFDKKATSIAMLGIERGFEYDKLEKPIFSCNKNEGEWSWLIELKAWVIDIIIRPTQHDLTKSSGR